MAVMIENNDASVGEIMMYFVRAWEVCVIAMLIEQDGAGMGEFIVYFVRAWEVMVLTMARKHSKGNFLSGFVKTWDVSENYMLSQRRGRMSSLVSSRSRE
jgi:hypothetical protein